VIKFTKCAGLIFTVLIIFITGCGSSSSGDVNLIGTYDLTNFLVKFSDGTIYTPNDLDVSGTMVIDAISITQNLTIEGIPQPPSSGQYTVTFTNADQTQGYFTFNDNNVTRTVIFTISGVNLTTYSGVFQVSPSVTAEEWDTWRKISDVPQASPFVGRSGNENGYRWIFESF